MKLKLSLAFVCLLSATAVLYAQRPGSFTTMWLTDTSTDALLVGCTFGSSTCTGQAGGIKAGVINVTGTANPLAVVSAATGVTHLQLVQTGTSDVNLELKRTAGTTSDWFVYLKNATTDMRLFGAGADRVTFFGSGGLGVGSTVDPGAGKVNTTGGYTTSSSAGYTAAEGAFGTGNVSGNNVTIGRNNSGSTAAGTLELTSKNAGLNFIWADASSAPGQLRISTAAPEEDGAPSDTSGTVVGTQASTRDVKNILNRVTNPRSALDAVLRAPVYRFTYKGGSYNGTTFTGIIADEFPAVMMDPDAKHPEGKSFSPVSAFGYTALSIKALQAEIDALRREVRALKRARHP